MEAELLTKNNRRLNSNWTMKIIESLIILMTALVLIPNTLINLKNFGLIQRIKVAIISGIFIYILWVQAPDEVRESMPTENRFQGMSAYYACGVQIMRTARFCNSESGFDDYSCFCTNPNAMATMAHCCQTAYDKLSTFFLDVCNRQYKIDVTKGQYELSLLNYSKFARSIDEEMNMAKNQKVSFPVKLNEEEMKLYHVSYDQFLGNYSRSAQYGEILVGYWVLIFVIFGIASWLKSFFRKSMNRRFTALQSEIRSRLTLPSLFSGRKTEPVQFQKGIEMLLPTRQESISLVVFFCLCIVFLFKGIHYYENDMIFSHRTLALLRYFAVRCSILASFLLPLVILTAGRNNFLQWLVHIDYATFIMFHRWFSRILMLFIVAHGHFYSLYIIRNSSSFMEPIILWGFLAYMAGSILIVQSILFFRRRWYEAFLVLHIIMAAVFLGAAYFHVRELTCLWLYYFAIAIWAFDRILRLERIFSFGFPLADVYVKGDDTLIVTVPVPSNWDIVPGGHAFIYFIKPSCFWQSHPFTYIYSESRKSIILYVKVKDGVTESIYQVAKKAPKNHVKVRVTVEGSYGAPAAVVNYDKAVFVASGSGIPGIYSEAIAAAPHMVREGQKIRLYWIVRDFKHLLWFEEELLALRNSKIQTIVYVTRGTSGSEYVDASDLSHSFANLAETGSDNQHCLIDIQKLRKTLNHIEFRYGRPLMGFLVSECCEDDSRSIAFATCGHPGMVDDLRNSIAKYMQHSEDRNIDFFEQLQVWS